MHYRASSLFQYLFNHSVYFLGNLPFYSAVHPIPSRLHKLLPSVRHCGCVPTPHLCTVSIGWLRHSLVSFILRLDRSRGFAGARGPAGEQAQSSSADQREPVELRGHEQTRSQITLPGHHKRDPVEGNRGVPAKEETDRECGRKLKKSSYNQKLKQYVSP